MVHQTSNNPILDPARRLLTLVLALSLPAAGILQAQERPATTAPAGTPRVVDANVQVVNKLLKVFRSSRTPETQKDTALALLLLPTSYDDLAEILSSKTEPTASRLAIVQALAEQPGNPPLAFIEPLFSAFESGEAKLSESAGLVLARIGDERVVDKLLAVGADASRPLPMRLAAVSALGQISNQESLHYTIDRLIQLMDNPQLEVSSQAMASLDMLTKINLGKNKKEWKDWWTANKNKPQESWLRDLNEILVQRNRTLQAAHDALRERLRITLEQVFTITPEANREALLLSWLKDPMPLVQLTALAKLDSFISNRQPDRITPGLRDLLRSMLKSPDPVIRAQTIGLLGTLCDNQSAESMVALFAKETEPAVKVELLFAISNLHVPQTNELLLKSLNDDSEVTVAGAARAIRQLINSKTLNGDKLPQVGQALIDRWNKTKPDQTELRESLLTTLGVLLASDPRTWSPRLAEIFKACAADLNSEVKLAAISGLGYLADLNPNDKVPQLLADALTDKDPRIRSAAADGLGKLSRSVEHFDLLIQHSVPEAESDAGTRDRSWAAAMKIMAGGSLDQFLPVIRRDFKPPFAERNTRAERMADLADQLFKPANASRLNPDSTRQLADLAADAYMAMEQYSQARQMLDLLPDDYPSKHGRSVRVMVREGDNLAEAVTYVGKQAGQPNRPGREEFLMTLYEEAQRLAKINDTDSLTELVELVSTQLKPGEEWQRRFQQLTKPAATAPSGG